MLLTDHAVTDFQLKIGPAKAEATGAVPPALLCHGIQAPSSEKKAALIKRYINIDLDTVRTTQCSSFFAVGYVLQRWKELLAQEIYKMITKHCKKETQYKEKSGCHHVIHILSEKGLV